MTARKYPGALLDSQHIHDLLSSMPSAIVQHGRDYVYQERVSHALHDPRFLLARLHGYQDSYVPFCIVQPTGLHVGCTCERSQPCAHLTALLWQYLTRPEEFMPPPPDLLQEDDPMIPRWAAGRLPWHLVPAQKPLWQQPWDDIKSLAFWDQATEQLRTIRRWTDSQLARILPQLHPSWVQQPAWRSRWSQLIMDHWHKLTQVPFPYWWALALQNPSMPLDPLWPAYIPLPNDTWLNAALNTMALNRAEASLYSILIDLATEPGLQWLQATIALKPDIDPWRLLTARILMRRNKRDQAVNLLRATWPDSVQGQHEVRRQLLEWLPLEQRLPYLVAECLESPDWGCLEALRPHLAGDAWQALQQAKAARLIPDATPNDPKE